MTHTTTCHRCGGGTGQPRPCDCAFNQRRVRGLLESIKLARSQDRSMTLHKDELAGLEAALVWALHGRS